MLSENLLLLLYLWTWVHCIKARAAAGEESMREKNSKTPRESIGLLKSPIV
jgi:hypothetical protein